MTSNSWPSINNTIKTQREKLGITSLAVANFARLSIFEYRDIESSPEEVFVVTPIYHLKKICQILNFEFLSLFEIKCVFCEKHTAYSEDFLLRRSALVNKKRLALELTEAALANQLGFETSEVHCLETYTAHLESWVLENIYWLGKLLDIPPQILVDVQCKKCGK